MKMEFEKFVEKYYQQADASTIFNSDDYKEILALLLSGFEDAMFRFLTDYTDKICEKQRENCVEAFEGKSFMRYVRTILNADQPKIDDIITE